MAKTINAVLNPAELERIGQIADEITDRNTIQIVENVFHVDCNAKEQGVLVSTYPSLNNPFLKRIATRKFLCPINRRDEQELMRKREAHLAFAERRDQIMKDELALRTFDIHAHKYFLSVDAGSDVGLLVASAHWLKDISEEFYDLSRRQHAKLGIDFSLKGMERAVVVSAPNSRDLEYYIFVMERDFFVEELLAQASGGVMDPVSEKVDFQKARTARERIEELCRLQFCILKAPQS